MSPLMLIYPNFISKFLFTVPHINLLISDKSTLPLIVTPPAIKVAEYDQTNFCSRPWRLAQTRNLR